MHACQLDGTAIGNREQHTPGAPSPSCYLQEFRGGAGFGLVPDLQADVPAAAWDVYMLMHKKIHFVNFFVHKNRVLPPGRR